MSNPTQPVLFSFRRCPYAMRARMALLVSGQEVELREVVLRNKPEAMIQVSAKATVPILIEPDGTVHDESLQIMLWSLERNDPEQWLNPQTGDQRAMLKLINQFDEQFKFHLDRYKYATRYENTDPQTHRSAAAHMLVDLNSRLNGQPYLFGRQAALADFALAPFVRQFANTDSDWFNDQAWTQLHHWLTTILSSNLFTTCMRKYAPWQPGTSGVRFSINS